jgi:hypothetical protein
VITGTPLEAFCLNKVDLYTYLTDEQRNGFRKSLRIYPPDCDLRRFYYEQSNFMALRKAV